MASMRVWLLAAVLACVLLLLSADADAPAPGPANVVAGGRGPCDPATNKTCRPGDPHAPENQEEEALSAANVMSHSFPGVAPGGDDDDDELPSFDTHLVILGH